MATKLLSIVIPCFNEEAVLHELVRRLKEVLLKVDNSYEVVLIDDGSRDKTWPIIEELSKSNTFLRGIKLSRNFGHQMALTCGLDQCRGDVIVIIDADLQDPPELIPDMIKVHESGYDVVYGKRKSRKGETQLKKFFAFAFYRIMTKITGIIIPEDTGDFRLISRRALNALLALRERHRFIRGMVSWIGFSQTPIFYEREGRFAGETKYPFTKSLLLAIHAITSFSYAPLRLASYLGVFVSGFAFLYIFVVIILKFMGINFSGYTSIMASILLLGGVQLIVLGIMGEYIGRIFEQGQGRPLYLVQEMVGE